MIKTHRWDRPQLPEANRSNATVAGIAMIGFGVIAFALSLSGGSPALLYLALFYGGAGLMAAGLPTMLTGLVINELRAGAFSQARRAGEVTENPPHD